MTTYLDTRKRPRPFLEVSQRAIVYIDSHLEKASKNTGHLTGDDDSHVRNTQVEENFLEFDNVLTFWTTLTKASDVIDNGKRMENISWRMVNRKLVLKDEFTKKDFNALVRVSRNETCPEIKSFEEFHSKRQGKRRLLKRISNNNMNNNTSNTVIPNSKKKPLPFQLQTQTQPQPQPQHTQNQVPSLFSNKKLSLFDDITSNSSTAISSRNNSNELTESKKGARFYIDHSSPESPSPPSLRKQLLLNNNTHKDQNQNKNSIYDIIENVKEKPANLDSSNFNSADSNAIKSNNSNANICATKQNPVIASLFGGKNDPMHSIFNQAHQNKIVRDREPVNHVPSLFTKKEQTKSSTEKKSTTLFGRPNLGPRVPSHLSEVLVSVSVSTNSNNSNNNNTPWLSKKDDANSTASLFQNKSQKTVVVYSSSSSDEDEDEDEEEDEDEDDDEQLEKQEDEDDEDEDDDSEWSSLSDDSAYDDEEDDVHETINFKKKSFAPSTEDEEKNEPSLKRSLLSGLFIDKLDKGDTGKVSKNMSSNPLSTPLNSQGSGSISSNLANNRKKNIPDHYDKHHRSNAPPTAATILPTAFTTHMFLPTRNFNNPGFEIAQKRHGGGGNDNTSFLPFLNHNTNSNNNYHSNHHTTSNGRNNYSNFNKKLSHNTAQNVKSPNDKANLTNDTYGNITDNSKIFKLTTDNIAKYANSRDINGKSENKGNDEEYSYASSIHTSTSSIDIPGTQNKIMREKRRMERQREWEKQQKMLREDNNSNRPHIDNAFMVKELPVNLVDSIHNENKLFGINNDLQSTDNLLENVNKEETKLDDDDIKAIKGVQNPKIYMSDGYIDDTIVKTIFGNNNDNDGGDDLDYYSKGW